MAALLRQSLPQAALGLLGGIGVVVMVFAFNLPPGKPPVDVMLTIVAVVAVEAVVGDYQVLPYLRTNGNGKEGYSRQLESILSILRIMAARSGAPGPPGSCTWK